MSPAEQDALLRQWQRLIVRYPFAAQALYAALLAEGRRYAVTSEGERWAQRLRHSDVVRRARAVWEATSLNVLEDDDDTLVPSKLLEALVRASSRENIEQSLRSLFADVISGVAAAPTSRDSKA